MHPSLAQVSLQVSLVKLAFSASSSLLSSWLEYGSEWVKFAHWSCLVAPFVFGCPLISGFSCLQSLLAVNPLTTTFSVQAVLCWVGLHHGLGPFIVTWSAGRVSAS